MEFLLKQLVAIALMNKTDDEEDDDNESEEENEYGSEQDDDYAINKEVEQNGSDSIKSEDLSEEDKKEGGDNSVPRLQLHEGGESDKDDDDGIFSDDEVEILDKESKQNELQNKNTWGIGHNSNSNNELPSLNQNKQ